MNVQPMDEVPYQVKSYAALEKQDLYRILQARAAVFVCEQAICYQDMDDLDHKAFHVWVDDPETGALMAYARILPPGTKYTEVSFGRVLIKKPYRGRGLGKSLIIKCLAVMAEYFPGSGIKISAQQYVEKFYQALGFKTVSDCYIEEGIPHICMLRCA